MTTASLLLRPIGVAVAGLTLVAGLGVAGVAPAHAETRTTPDAVGDPVRTSSDDAADDGVETEPAPQAAQVDLVSTRYEYRRQFLVVRGTARAAGRGVFPALRVRASGRDYSFFRAPGGGVWGFSTSARTFDEVRCPGGRSTVDPDRSTYGLRIPAGCFGAPDSARLGFAVSLDRSTRRSSVTTEDDANRSGGSSDFGSRPRLGAVLERGAAARTTPDAVGDPVRTTFVFDGGGDGEGPTGQPAPLARQVDLTSTRFDYRRQFLVVRGTAQAAGRGVQVALRVRAAGEEFFFFRAPGGRIFGFGTSRGNEGPQRCGAGSSRVDTERGSYVLRVPAACFGSPDSARVGFGLSLDRSTRRSFSTTVDDASRDGGATDVFRLRLGPALARG